MAKDIANFMQSFKEFQRQMQPKHYGKISTKLHDLHPWSQVIADNIGPWTINTTKKDAPITLLALTKIMVHHHSSF